MYTLFVRTKIYHFLNTPFYRSSFLMTIGSFAGNLLNYAFNFISARALGPAGYGEIVSLFSYLSILTIPVVIPSTIITQKISAHRADRAVYASTIEAWILKKYARWWWLFILFVILSPLTPYVTNLSLTTSIALVPLLLFSVVGAFYLAALQGLRRFQDFISIGLISTIIKLIGALLVFLGIFGFNSILIMLIASAVFSFYQGKKIFTRYTGMQDPKNHTVYTQRIAGVVANKQFVITALSLIAVMLFNNVDIMFVKKFYSAHDAGIYSAWSLFAKIIFYVIGPIIAVGFVFFADKTDDNHVKTLKSSLMILMFISACGVSIYSFFPSLVVSIFFGTQFQAVQKHLPSAALFGMFYAAIFLINNYFIATNDKKSITLALTMPLYALGLFSLSGTNISHIIQYNMSYSLAMAIIYIILLAKSIHEVRTTP